MSVVKGTDPIDITLTAVKLAGGLANVVRRGDVVLVKPNLVTALPASSGASTDPRIVEALVQLSREAGARDVIIAEGSGGSTTTDAFSVCGYYELSERIGVKLIDLNADAKVNLGVKDGFLFKSFSVAKTVAECDVIINVAKMKTNIGCVLSGTIKNILGVIPGTILNRGPYKDQGPKTGLIDCHIRGLNYAIIDLNRALRTNFAVIDALVGMQGKGPAEGTPVKMGLVLAGVDPVATDAVEAAIMGFDPQKILHLRLASQAGLGVSSLDQIEVKGESLHDVMRTFKPCYAAHRKDFGL